MSDKKVTNTEREFWLTVKQRMTMSEYDIQITRKRVKQLQAQLPGRKANESVGDWIRRTGQLCNTDKVISDTENEYAKAKNLRCLAHVERLAADPGDSCYPLPDPGWIYESEDGRWRLKILSGQDTIELFFQALSYAVDDFAGHNIVFWDETDDKPFAYITLDEDGDGNCQLQNTLVIRKALCQPYILIEEI